jgi:hypothetical protein
MRDSASVLLEQKVTRFFSLEENAARKRRLIAHSQVVAFYVTQFCARNNVVIFSSSADAAVGYPVYVQYKKMANLYGKPMFSVPVERASKLAVLHFFYWFISRDIDRVFLADAKQLTIEMQLHRQSVSRVYRVRQEIKRAANDSSLQKRAPPLGPTASKRARHSRPCVHIAQELKTQITQG